MIGATLKFTYGTDSFIYSEENVTVGSENEFSPYSLAFIDVDATTVEFRETVQNSNTSVAFDNYTISDYDNQLPDIIGLTLISSTEVDFSQVTFDSDNISIDLSGGSYNSAEIKFSVQFASSAPTEIELSNVYVKENRFGAVVGTLTAKDFDQDSGFQFYFAAATPYFEIVDGVLKVIDNLKIDYELTGPVFHLSIGVADTDGNTYIQNIDIYVEDVLEKIDGNSRNNKLVGTEFRDFLRGREGNDVLRGNDGDDVLRSDRGNDILIGGNGADTFIFTKGSQRDTIKDMELGDDVIKLVGFKGIDTFEDVKRHAANHGDDVWITLGKDTIVISDHHKSELSDYDFAL